MPGSSANSCPSPIICLNAPQGERFGPPRQNALADGTALLHFDGQNGSGSCRGAGNPPCREKHSLLSFRSAQRRGTCLFSTVRLWWFKRCRRLNWLGQGSTDGIWLILTIHKKIHSTGRESIPRPCSFDHPAGLPIFANPELLRECRRALQPHQTHRPLLESRFEW